MRQHALGALSVLRGNSKISYDSMDILNIFGVSVKFWDPQWDVNNFEIFSDNFLFAVIVFFFATFSVVLGLHPFPWTTHREHIIPNLSSIRQARLSRRKTAKWLAPSAGRKGVNWPHRDERRLWSSPRPGHTVGVKFVRLTQDNGI